MIIMYTRIGLVPHLLPSLRFASFTPRPQCTRTCTRTTLYSAYLSAIPPILSSPEKKVTTAPSVARSG